MYIGATEKGIEQETLTTQFCSKICQTKNIRCLAVPSVSLLHMGSSLSDSRQPRTLFDSSIQPEPSVLFRGIRPALTSAVKEELQEPTREVDQLHVAAPDAHVDPLAAVIDPYDK